MPELICLNLLPDEDYRLAVIHGVVDYVRREPSLRLATFGGVPYVPWDELGKFGGAGVIAMAHTRRAVRRLVQLRLPVVNVSSQVHQDELASVTTDDAAVGRLAADHLLNCGLKKFVCVYYPRWANDKARMAAFRDRVSRAGFPVKAVAVSFCQSVERLETERPEVDTAKLARRLVNLSRPVGIFATHDEFSAASVDALRSHGASLPCDAPILGVANNRLICASCAPLLSSIVQSGQRVGFEAVAALQRLLRGERLAERHLRLPPLEVAVRRSTNVLATRDELVAEAIEQIRLRSSEPFTVTELAELMCVSRSGLYKRFMAALGHTPNEEIRRARLARAEKLLSTTELQIPHVAFDCGYRSVGAFCRAFRDAVGATPIEYRKRTRSSA